MEDCGANDPVQIDLDVCNKRVCFVAGCLGISMCGFFLPVVLLFGVIHGV